MVEKEGRSKMAKRGMNVYKRKDGRWEGRFMNKNNGKYCSVYGKTYGETREKLIEKQKQTTVSSKKCPLTVEELFELWLCHIRHRIKESSFANYVAKLQTHIYPSLGSLKFESLTTKHITDFINNKLTNGKKDGSSLSAKYVSDIVALLRSIGKFAQQEYHYHNPILNIKAPKIRKKELTILSQNEQLALKKYLLKEPSEIHLGILLCLNTGIRLGELCALKWSDIDLNERVIKISKTVQRVKSFNGKKATELITSSPKSEKSAREIPLPSFLYELLLKHKKFGNSFILSGSERIVEPRLMQYHFKRVLKKVNLPSINFHTLRHMFATNCIEHGFDVKTLSEILGHSKVEITLNIYTHSSKERKRECMERLRLIS